MATAKETEQTVNTTQLAEAFAAAMRLAQPPKELREGDPEYVARMKAEGLYDEFEHPVYQNGKEAEARGLSEQTRYRASHLKAGLYWNKRVRVDVANNGAVYLNYPSRGDEMLKNSMLWRSFDELIDRIWAEMTAPVAA